MTSKRFAAQKIFSFFLVFNLAFFNLAPSLTLAEDGGSGGDGGFIETGNSQAVSSTENVANSNTLSNGDARQETEDNLNSTSAVQEPASDGDIPSYGEGNTSDVPLTPENNGQQENGHGDFTIQGSGYDGSPLENIEDNNDGDSGVSSSVDAEVKNENDAEISNDTNVDAASGDNAANGGSSDESGSGGDGGVIFTGDAYAAANVVNIANTNIIDATGFFLLLNNFGSLLSDFDFRNLNFPSECPAGCSFFGPDSSLSVSNKNKTEITNDVIVRASSGSNSASGGSSSSGAGGSGGIIATGDAAAGANVLNIANTNIVGSNYLVFAFNNFGNFAGDFVFPSKYFFEEFLKNKCCKPDIKVKNENGAEVQNDVSTEAESGGNEANGGEGGLESDGGQGGIILSGDSNSHTNVSNTINSNLFGDDTFILVVRVFGDWVGNVFGAPGNISWQKTDEGLLVYDNGPNGDNNSEEENNGGSISISNENEASVKNNVRVFALTGDNKANGGEGESGGDGGIVATGEASAGANIVNVVNTNIVGRNWILAFVNVFGNWHGNVAFGRPDLWVGERILVPGDAEGPEIVPGSLLTYTITVINKGDTDATEVLLKDQFASGLLDIKTLGGGYYEDEDEVYWELGTLKPGEMKEVTYQTEIKPQLPFTATHFMNTATVSSFEEDENPEDNTETTIVQLTRRIVDPAPTFSPSANEPRDPILLISKTHNAPFGIEAGDSVDYTIILKNEGFGSAYDVAVNDELSFVEDGVSEVAASRSWELGEVFPGEEIVIEYTLEIASHAPPGIYKNFADADGKNQRGFEVFAPSVSSELMVTEPRTIIAADSVVPSNGGSLLDEFSSTTGGLEESETDPSPGALASNFSNFSFDGDSGEESKIIPEAKAVTEIPDVSAFLATEGKNSNKNYLASLFGFNFGTFYWILSLLGILFLILLLRDKKEEE